MRRAELDRTFVDDELAFVGTNNSCDCLHERRLAGPIVADEREHLAGVDVEVDSTQRRDAAETLPNASQHEERRGTVLVSGAVQLRHRRHHRRCVGPTSLAWAGAARETRADLR